MTGNKIKGRDAYRWTILIKGSPRRDLGVRNKTIPVIRSQIKNSAWDQCNILAVISNLNIFKGKTPHRSCNRTFPSSLFPVPW